MPEASLYRIAYAGKLSIVRAEGRNAIKAHVLKDVGFECRAASAEDVVDFMADGGKVDTIAGAAIEGGE